ncbi:MAG: phosphotransferase [Rhodocyclaceae bacterium]|nr:phosphotransferase [Rhodocyclaceae bacterium]
MDAPALPRDARLPQLARAVDGRAMGHVFEAALRQYGVQRVTDCQVERIKYRPGRNCTVSYRLEIRDERQGCSYTQRVAGRFCAPGEAARRHARNASRVGLASRCGVPSLLVPSLELFAWFLPNDPKLASLPILIQATRNGGSALSEALEVMTGGEREAIDLHAALVQYVPESRACARFDVRLASGREASLFAKLDRENGGAATHRVMQALHASEAARDGRLRTARPLLWQAQTGLHWQAAVAGRPLIDLHPHCPPPVAARIGTLMAALHDTEVPLARSLGGDALHAQACEIAALLTQVEPAWFERLSRLLGLLEAPLPDVRALPEATLHGDLHPRNILVNGDALSLIDLDGARGGPAVLELGAWIAEALDRAIHAGTPLDQVQASAESMLDAYTQASRQPVTQALVAWATARALLCERAYRGMANLRPGRFEQVPVLLSLAELIAGQQRIDGPLPR